MASKYDELKSLKLEGLSGTNHSREALAAYILANRSDPTTQHNAHSSSSGPSLTNVVASLEKRITEMIDTKINAVSKTMDDVNTLLVAVGTKLKDERVNRERLEDRVCALTEIVLSQQRQLERLDTHDRARNLIVLNVPEDGTPIDDADSDPEKLSSIFSMTCPDEIIPVHQIKSTRLGNKRDDGSYRPTLVTLPNPDLRQRLVSKSSVLTKNSKLKNIRLKKDQHPAIRKEWRRLFNAERAAKADPDNEGCTIILDRKSRTLLRDELVIDRFMANF